MKTDRTVSITLEDGRVVKGEITTRTEADLLVVVRSPHNNLSAGLHIPYFSRPFNSFLTEYGDRTAENLLKYLNELGKYMDENEKFLKLQFASHFRNENLSDWKCINRFFDSSFPCPVPNVTRSDILRRLK
jgi:hypothetical protein